MEKLTQEQIGKMTKEELLEAKNQGRIPYGVSIIYRDEQQSTEDLSLPKNN